MTRPSFQDYGTYDESAYPELWDGVVGYWAPCLGPTGTRLHDVSRYNNWGTLTNMDAATDWVIGGGQYALDFDGTNDYVTGAAPSLSLSIPFTVSLWYYPRVRAAYIGLVSVMTAYNEGSTDGWIIQDGAGGSNAFVGMLCGGTQMRISSSVLNAWQHYVAVFNGSSSQLYRNGSLQLSGTTGTPSYSSTPVLKLATWIGTNGFNNCLMDDIVVYRRSLMPNEVARLYNLGRGGMLERRRRRRVYSVQADVVRSYLFANRGQVIGGGTL